MNRAQRDMRAACCCAEVRPVQAAPTSAGEGFDVTELGWVQATRDRSGWSIRYLVNRAASQSCAGVASSPGPTAAT